MNEREIIIGRYKYCRACAGEAYYQALGQAYSLPARKPGEEGK